MSASSPLTNSRTVAGWATDERISATASTESPRFEVDGVVSRSTRTSSDAPSPISRVSIRMSRVAASAASDWPPPVVSLPSDSRTMRFWASSGNSAVARRRAAPMSVAERTGVDASRSISREVRWQALDERLLAERDDAGHVPVRDDVEGLAQERERVLAAVVPDRVREVHDEHRREPVDRQDDPEPGQGEHERDQERGPHARARTRRRPAPSRRRAPRYSDDRQAERRDQQEQRERRLEAEAHQAVPPASRRSRVASDASDPDERRHGGTAPTRRTGRQHEQDDRDPQLVAGRRAARSSAGGAVRRARATPPAVVPSASMAAAEPGAIVDSSTSNRSTAKCTGASGSSGGGARRRAGRGRRAEAAGRRARPRTGRRAAAGTGRRGRRRVRIGDRRDRVHAEQVGRGEASPRTRRSCPARAR